MEKKEELKEEMTEEYGGLGKSVFICKKEDFKRQPGQPYINEEGNLVTFVGQGDADISHQKNRNRRHLRL